MRGRGVHSTRPQGARTPCGSSSARTCWTASSGFARCGQRGGPAMHRPHTAPLRTHAQTLLHEMCHAAAWMVQHNCKPAHGKCFWHWGQRATGLYPELKVTTTHSYAINYAVRWVRAAAANLAGLTLPSVRVQLYQPLLLRLHRPPLQVHRPRAPRLRPLRIAPAAHQRERQGRQAEGQQSLQVRRCGSASCCRA